MSSSKTTAPDALNCITFMRVEPQVYGIEWVVPDSIRVYYIRQARAVRRGKDLFDDYKIEVVIAPKTQQPPNTGDITDVRIDGDPIAKRFYVKSVSRLKNHKKQKQYMVIAQQRA